MQQADLFEAAILHQLEVVERMLNPCIRGLILYFGVGSGKTLSSMAEVELVFWIGLKAQGLFVVERGISSIWNIQLVLDYSQPDSPSDGNKNFWPCIPRLR